MTVDGIAFWLRYTALFVSGIALGVSWLTMRVWQRRAQRMADGVKTLTEQLALIGEATDPGREVHVRLAAAMEAMVLLGGDGEDPNPAMRRAAAMSMAGSVLAAARRAKLDIVPMQEPES